MRPPSLAENMCKSLMLRQLDRFVTRSPGPDRLALPTRQLAVWWRVVVCSLKSLPARSQLLLVLLRLLAALQRPPPAGPSQPQKLLQQQAGL